MTDKSEIKLLTKESIALKLTTDISSVENIYDDKENYRKRILDLYAECLEATSNQRSFSSESK